MPRSLPLSIELLLLSIVLPMLMSAQEFSPFTMDGRKLFATPDKHATFGIAFDSTTVDAGTVTYHNYKTVWDTLTTTGCAFWVGDQCYKQDRPTWAGPRIEVDGQGVHTFFNLWNEPIVLAFSTEPGSQTLIYAGDEEQFLLSYVGEAPSDLLGLEENVRQWTIQHQDLNGQSIDSPLNNAPVEVGATVGLARYFRIDSFPLVLQPVELVGQSSPPLGLHTITPAFLNDFQPGDEIQVHDFANYYVGPPWLDRNVYEKRTVLSRSDTPTEVTYEMELVSYNVDSATVVTSTITQSFSKVDVLATIPFDRFDGTGPTLKMMDYCGLPLWTWRTELNTGLGYCAEENCWGFSDTNGPPPYGTTLHVGGLGVYATSESIQSPSGYNKSRNVVYFKKNGIECMNEVVMSISEGARADQRLKVLPNPANEAFSYQASGRIVSMEALDSQGRVVERTHTTGSSGTVNTSDWPPGMYLLRLIMLDGVAITHRLAICR